jgi:peptidoglycan hydrolase-like protein with peptidoglycan-binding domain
MTYDPRHFGTTHYKYTGDTSIDFLSGKWAVPGKYTQPDGSIITYGGQIAKIASIINGETIVDDPIIPILKKGDKGIEVTKLQKYLIYKGYYLVADGDFGPITEAKVKEFQKANNLKITGYVDSVTKDKMNNFILPTVNTDLDIIIQMGHIGRTKGSTGTAGEQAFTKALGDEIGKLLKGGRLNYRIMGADNWTVPKPNKATVFLSLHADGSTNTSARGFSMGFKPGTSEVFKEYIAIPYKELCGFSRRKDNYTSGMVKYYSWKHIDCPYTALIEHGFMTNDIERAWITSHIKDIAQCHVSSIKKFFKEVKGIE